MAPQSGDLNPTVSIGEVSSCHAARTTAECDSASEPAGDERASDSVVPTNSTFYNTMLAAREKFNATHCGQPWDYVVS